MPIRAILFDLDNTLILEDEATARALERTSELAAGRTGADATVIQGAARDAAEGLFRASRVFGYADAMGIWWGEALWGDFAGEQPDLAALRAFVPGFRREVWRRGLAAAAVSDDALVGELASAYPAFRRALPAIDPDAEPTLRDLGRDHRLGLVTNGAPDVQREKLARTTLSSRFAAIVISGDIGIGKPDPRIFQAALDILGTTAADAVMVGDSIERDIAGARHAGLRGVWLDRAGSGTREGSVIADARIRALPELRDSLIGLERVDAFPQPA